MQELPANQEARLRAIEFLVVNMYGIENRRRGWDADRISQEHNELLSRMSGKPDNPLSREIYQAMERLLRDNRALT